MCRRYGSDTCWLPRAGRYVTWAVCNDPDRVRTCCCWLWLATCQTDSPTIYRHCRPHRSSPLFSPAATAQTTFHGGYSLAFKPSVGVRMRTWCDWAMCLTRTDHLIRQTAPWPSSPVSSQPQNPCKYSRLLLSAPTCCASCVANST